MLKWLCNCTVTTAAIVGLLVSDSLRDCVRSSIAAAASTAAAQPLATIAVVAATAVFIVWLRFYLDSVPTVEVPLTPEEASDDGVRTAPAKEMRINDPSQPGCIQCFDPSTLQPLGSVPCTPAKEVRAIVERARVAQAKWAKTSFAERRRVLRMLNAYVLRNQDSICRVSTRDTGKTKLEGLFGEVLTTCAKIAWMNEYGEDLLKPEYRPVTLMMAHKTARVEYLPLGVLGVIAPWNYPFHNFMNHIISGLFAGNAVVSKMSEYSAWSGQYYLRIIHKVLQQAGHSPDLVQMVSGFGDVGAALVSSGVDKIIFTGSPQVGKMVMKQASETLTPVVLELGGKDPFIVCDDADLSQVVQIALRGTYQNCGQNCIGIERVYAYAAIHDEFVAQAAALVKQFRVGAPLVEGVVDMGAMTMPQSLAMIQELVDDAVRRGAKVVVGGQALRGKNGLFYQPTILTNVTHDMRIVNEEVFGPVMTIIKVANDDECIRLVNSTAYGLGSSVFSRDTARAERLGARVRAGMTNINDFGVNYLMQSLPFGGVGVSGFDRFGGAEGLRSCCLLKSVVSDRFPGVRTSMPPPLQYPAKAAAIPFSKGLIGFLYGDSIPMRIKGVIEIIKASMAK